MIEMPIIKIYIKINYFFKKTKIKHNIVLYNKFKA